MNDEAMRVETARLELSQLKCETVQEALDEIEREYNVRKRCFPRWVQEGRVSATEARDRLCRQGHAAHIVKIVLDIVSGTADAESVPAELG